MNSNENHIDNATGSNKEILENELKADIEKDLHDEFAAEIKKQIEASKPKKKHHIIRNIFLLLLAAIIIAGIVIAINYQQIAKSLVTALAFRPFEYSEEIEKEFCPVDEERAAAVDALPKYAESDTWAFYYYIVGSNLESGAVSQISGTTQRLIADEVQAIYDEALEKSNERFKTVNAMLKANKLELPQAFFRPDDSDPEEAEDDGSTITGLISEGTIRQLMELELPSNVKIVMQTGGAGAWAMTQINPNRSQRFLLEAGDAGLQELSNTEIVNMADQDTLADFLRFCRENYPADHEVVCFVDHGGASIGFGLDEIYNDIAGLDRISGAFSEVCTADEKNPPFEMIDFQCCLMSSAEAASYLKGYAKYMTCAEETTYTYLDGSQATKSLYTAMDGFINAPGENGAQLGKRRADAYAAYMVSGAQGNGVVNGSDTGVLDLNKAASIYDLYKELVKSMLKKAVEDPAWLSVYSHAANGSIFMAGNDYKTYNTIDLELFMQNLAPYFPEETQAVIDAIESAVLYRRAASYMNGTYGISVYFPAHIDSDSSLGRILKYLDSITDSKDIQALYYYKAFGCMPDSLMRYCRSAGYGDVKTLDFTPMNTVGKLPVELNDTMMSMVLTDEQAAVVASAVLDFGELDEDAGVIRYYGRDQYIGFDADDPTAVISDFENKWISLNGQPLYLKLINSTDTSITYSTPIMYQYILNRELLLSYDFETKQVSILGMKRIGDNADTLDIALESLRENDAITPIHYETAIDGSGLEEVSGDPVKVDDKLLLEETVLPDGKYLERIAFSDLRSDEYYSQLIGFTMKDGAASEIAKAPNSVYFSRLWN